MYFEHFSNLYTMPITFNNSPHSLLPLVLHPLSHPVLNHPIIPVHLFWISLSKKRNPKLSSKFRPIPPSRTHLNPTYHLGTGVLNNKLKSPFVTKNPKMHAQVLSRARSAASTSSTKIIVKRRRGVFARISALFFPITTTVEADGGRA